MSDCRTEILNTFRDGALIVEGLKVLMKEAGISQNALARHMGVDPALISRWFTPGPPNPNLESLIRLSLAVEEMREAAQS